MATTHPSGIDTVRFGLGIRALRRRRGLTQQQLALRARVSRAVIWRIERGSADRVAVHRLVGVASALGARIDVRLLWHGEGLDRLLDERHARLVELTVRLLLSSGWEAATEVSFNLRGERGSIDVFARHPAADHVLVVEVKSVVPDIQAMLHGLDRKGRLAREIASDRGWAVRSVTRVLILPEDRTSRRRVEMHADTIRAALPARTARLKAWLRNPTGSHPGNGVLFLTDAPQKSQSHGSRPNDTTGAAP